MTADDLLDRVLLRAKGVPPRSTGQQFNTSPSVEDLSDSSSSSSPSPAAPSASPLLTAYIAETMDRVAEFWVEGAPLPPESFVEAIDQAALGGDRDALAKAVTTYERVARALCLNCAPCKHVTDSVLIEFYLDHPELRCARCEVARWKRQGRWFANIRDMKDWALGVAAATPTTNPANASHGESRA